MSGLLALTAAGRPVPSTEVVALADGVHVHVLVTEPSSILRITPRLLRATSNTTQR